MPAKGHPKLSSDPPPQFPTRAEGKGRSKTSSASLRLHSNRKPCVIQPVSLGKGTVGIGPVVRDPGQPCPASNIRNNRRNLSHPGGHHNRTREFRIDERVMLKVPPESLLRSPTSTRERASLRFRVKPSSIAGTGSGDNFIRSSQFVLVPFAASLYRLASRGRRCRSNSALVMRSDGHSFARGGPILSLKANWVDVTYRILSRRYVEVYAVDGASKRKRAVVVAHG
jgi:hypothetical protein